MSRWVSAKRGRGRKTSWKKGKIHSRKGKGKGRWEYPNGKKKGRRWRKVR